MFYYYIYGNVVAADIEFPQLVKAEAVEEADIFIEQGDMPNWILEEMGNKKYDFGNEISWLNNMACTFYVEKGKKIVYCLKPDATLMKLRNYLLGFGMSMLFLQRGEMAIHCSALHNGREAILIAGESGSGKSTLTNSYLEKGWKLMADDVVLAKYDAEKGTMVYPAFPYQKLCRNVAVERGYDLNELIYVNESKDKFLVPYRGGFDVTPKPLRKFIMLCVYPGDEVEVKEMTGFDKFMVCANNLFLRNLLKERKYEPRIGQKCIEIISKVDVHVILRPEDGDTTERIRQEAFQITQS